MKTVIITVLVLTTSLFGFGQESWSKEYDFHTDETSVESSGRSIQSDPIFPIGTKWTYEYSPVVPGGPSGLDSLIEGIIEFEIVDTFRRNDSLFYSFGEEHNFNMYQDEEKIYLDYPYLGLQLTYDFANTDQYYSRFFSPRKNRIDTAIVNVSMDPNYFDFGDRGLQPVQNLSIENNGTYEDMNLSTDILHHCGNLYGGLSLGIGLELADPPYLIGDIRCFEQGDFQFNFTGNVGDPGYVSCDSVRYISTTKDDQSAIVSILPNPFTHQISVTLDHTKSCHVQVIDMKGRIVKSIDMGNRTTVDIDLEELPSNMYIVDIIDKYGKRLYQQKVFKTN